MVWDGQEMRDGGHFQFYGAAFDSIIHNMSQQRSGGILGLGGGPWFEANHRIEISDCYVESHWQSGGYISGGGQCDTGNCSMLNYWIMRNNRGGTGAVLAAHSENSVQEGNIGLSCCSTGGVCDVGARANVPAGPFIPAKPFTFLENVRKLLPSF